MKNIIYILVFFGYTNSLFAVGHWERVDSFLVKDYFSTEYFSTNFHSIKCIDGMNCAASARVAFIYPALWMTSDGGENWRLSLYDSTRWTYFGNGSKKLAYFPSKSNYMVYPDTSLCIITCDSSYYWISRDNGITWDRRSIDTSKSVLHHAYFYDKNFGAILADEKTYNLYYTFDGAETWNKWINQYPDSLIPVYVQIPEKDVIIFIAYSYFLDKDIIIYTHDGGKTWHETDGLSSRFQSIWFFDKMNGFAAGSERPWQNKYWHEDVLLKTTDGGNTWEKVIDSLVMPYNYCLQKIYFRDRNNGYAIGPGKMWITKDGGESWTFDSTSAYQFTRTALCDIAYLNGDTVLGCENMYGEIMKYIPESSSGIALSKEEIFTDILVSPNPILSGEAFQAVFILPNAGNVRLVMYNSLGALASEPYSGELPAGENALRFTPDANLPSGSYFLRLILNGIQIGTAKFVVR